MKIWQLFFCAVVFFIHSQKAHAQSAFTDSLEQVLASAEDPAAKLLAALTLVNYGINNDLSLANEYINFGLSEAERLNDEEFKIKFLYGKTLYFFLTGRLDSTLLIAQKGKQLAQKKALERFYPQFLNLEANVYTQQLAYQEATATYLEGFKTFKEKKDTLNMAVMCAGLGMVYAYQDTNMLAIHYYEQAVALYEAVQAAPTMLLPNYTNLAELYLEDHEKALAYSKKALELAQQINSARNIAGAYLQMGTILKRMGNFEGAIEKYLLSKDIFVAMQDSLNLYQAQRVLGELYAQTNQEALAVAELEPVIQFFRAKGSSIEIFNALKILGDLYYKKGEYQRAYDYLEESYNITQEIYNESKLKLSTEQEALYKNQEKEIQLANQKLELAQQKNLRNLTLFIAAGLILIGLGVFQYVTFKRKQRQKEIELALSIQRAEAKQLKELDQIKSNFFANISHEFRTPLTLIISPLKEMVHGNFSGNLKTYQQIMLRNAERLLNLINQLLDLSKLEADKMELQLETHDLNQLIRELARAFISYAESRQIDFSIQLPTARLRAEVDPDKFEKIINNLLSNALKFTPEEGSVVISLEHENQWAIIKVEDTGIGISEKDLPHVFDRFYQVDAYQDRGYEGSGIGLALASELVALHKGKIKVESKRSAGSVFTVYWPLLEATFAPEDGQLLEQPQAQPLALTVQKKKVNFQNKTNKVLVVEDNEDVRFYVTDKLRAEFEILEADNGRLGLEIAKAEIPDLIISDVMMPEMNGVQLSKQLKDQPETSHIPIIMLTAKSDIDSKLEGLKTGADDYLTKPIDARELLVRIDNLLEQRKKLRAKYSKNLVLSNQSPVEQWENPEDLFMARVMSIVSEHLEDETFGVEDLAKAMLLSRYQLLRKIKALTGKSVSVFIRWVRLSRAKELLENEQGNVSEVSFRLGFNSVAYFSKCFKEEFGLSPSQLIKRC